MPDYAPEAIRGYHFVADDTPELIRRHRLVADDTPEAVRGHHSASDYTPEAIRGYRLIPEHISEIVRMNHLVPNDTLRKAESNQSHGSVYGIIPCTRPQPTRGLSNNEQEMWVPANR